MLAAAGTLAAAVMHVLVYEYPISEIATATAPSPPFVHFEGVAIAFLLASFAVVGWIESGRYRFPATIAGIGLVLYMLPFELSGVELVAGWAAVALIPFWLRRYPSMSEVPDTWMARTEDRALIARHSMVAIAAGAWLLAAAHTVAFEFFDARSDRGSGTPFTDEATLAAAIVIGVATAAAFLTRRERWSIGWILAAFAIAAFLIPTQVGTAAVVVGWSLLGACALVLAERIPADRTIYFITMFVLAGLGLLVALDVAPPARLSVQGSDLQTVASHPLFWSGASAALGALAALLTVSVVRFPDIPYRRWLSVLAGVLVVYLLSVGIVDHFQGQVGTVGIDALEKRAQVALSILWATLGGAAFVAGIVFRRRLIRLFGLGLLGIATVKVFVYDMASPDASYRVLSLIGLGLLLLASSYLYMRVIGNLVEEDREEFEDPSSPDRSFESDEPEETQPGA
jgi:hypothetical protein